MIFLLLLASLASAQDDRIYSIDTRLRSIESGRPTITGQPKFQNGIRFNDNSLQTTAYYPSSYTLFTASATFQSTVTFTLAPPSGATIANALYGALLPKVAARFTGGASLGVDYQVNVTSVTRIGTGRYDISVATVFNSTTSMLTSCFCRDGAAQTFCTNGWFTGTATTSHVYIGCSDAGGSLSNVDSVEVLVFGPQ